MLKRPIRRRQRNRVLRRGMLKTLRCRVLQCQGPQCRALRCRELQVPFLEDLELFQEILVLDQVQVVKVDSSSLQWVQPRTRFRSSVSLWPTAI